MKLLKCTSWWGQVYVCVGIHIFLKWILDQSISKANIAPEPCVDCFMWWYHSHIHSCWSTRKTTFFNYCPRSQITTLFIQSHKQHASATILILGLETVTEKSHSCPSNKKWSWAAQLIKLRQPLSVQMFVVFKFIFKHKNVKLIHFTALEQVHTWFITCSVTNVNYINN